jgi:hypothetical protein
MSAALPANLTEGERNEVLTSMGQGMTMGGAVDQIRKRQGREAERARRDGSAPLAADVLAELAEMQRDTHLGMSTRAALEELRRRRPSQLRAVDPGIGQAEADALLDEVWFADPPPLSDEEQRKRGRLKVLLAGWVKARPDLTLTQARRHLQVCQMSHIELLYTSNALLSRLLEEVRQGLKPKVTTP